MREHKGLRYRADKIRTWYLEAFQAFRNHQVVSRCEWDAGAGGRWLFQHEGNMDLMEIIAGACGSVLVHGDHDTVRFAYGNGDALARLGWIAWQAPGSSYLLEKAVIGGGKHSAERYDAQAARLDLEEEIRQSTEDGSDSRYTAMLQEALTRSLFESEHDLWAWLSEEDEGWDVHELTLGTMMRCSVVFAHVAVNRTVALIGEEPEDRESRLLGPSGGGGCWVEGQSLELQVPGGVSGGGGGVTGATMTVQIGAPAAAGGAGGTVPEHR